MPSAAAAPSVRACVQFEAPVIFKLCALIFVSNSNSSTGNHLSVFIFSKIKSKSMKVAFQLFFPPQNV